MLDEISYDEDTQRLIDRGFEALVRANQEMKEAWGFGDTERWDADMDAGTLTFTDPGLVVVAPLQVIGSYRDDNHSWLWSWANPAAVRYPFAEAARRVHDLGEDRGISPFTEPIVYCTEDDA